MFVWACNNLYQCLCVHVGVYISVCVYMQLFVSVFVCICKCLYQCLCVYASVCISVCVYMQVFVSVFMCGCKCLYQCVCVCVDANVCIMSSFMHVCESTCTQVSEGWSCASQGLSLGTDTVAGLV